jgi:hypothetical protein
MVHWLDHPYQRPPVSPLPAPRKAIARGFIVLLNVYEAINHILSPSFLSFTLLLPQVTPLHTLYLLYTSIFHYEFLSQCSKGLFNMWLHWVHFTLVSSTLSITLPHPFPPNPPFSMASNIPRYIFYLHKCYYGNIVNTQSAMICMIFTLESSISETP